MHVVFDFDQNLLALQLHLADGDTDLVLEMEKIFELALDLIDTLLLEFLTQLSDMFSSFALLSKRSFNVKSRIILLLGAAAEAGLTAILKLT